MQKPIIRTSCFLCLAYKAYINGRQEVMIWATQIQLKDAGRKCLSNVGRQISERKKHLLVFVKNMVFNLTLFHGRGAPVDVAGGPAPCWTIPVTAPGSVNGIRFR